tara:strand:+ start:450 stop:803 length:354 start_codon:yes stop_codon:yes gene_type:complete
MYKYYTFVIREITSFGYNLGVTENTFFDTLDNADYKSFNNNLSEYRMITKLFPDHQPNNVINGNKFVLKHHETDEIMIVELMSFKEITEDEYKVLSNHLTYWKEKYSTYSNYSSLKP